MRARNFTRIVALAAVALAGALVGTVAFGALLATSSAAPSNLRLVSATERTATIGWTAADNATGYALYRDGVKLSTAGASAVTARFGVSYGTHTLGVQALAPGGAQLSTITVDNHWQATATTYPPPPTTTATTTTTTVPTTTTTPTTTTVPTGSINLGALYLAAGPGSTVVIPCGSYGPQQITGQNPGPVTLQAAQPHCVTIAGDLTLGVNNGSPSGNAPSNLTIDGIDVTGGGIVGWYESGTPTSGFVYRNAKVSCTQGCGNGIYLYSFQQSTIGPNVEVGPICCNGDGIDMAIPRQGAPSPDGITLDTVNVHDIYDSCTILRKTLPTTPCSGQGFEDGCASCAHPDGTQWYGGLNATIRNSTFTNINPGGTAAQGIFMSQANGGLYSNITISNNTLGPTANNDLGISGPGPGVVTGFVKITGNHVAGNIRLYGDPQFGEAFAPGIQITVAQNVADVYQTTHGNGCDLILSDGTLYTPTYIGNVFGNHQCQG